MAVKSRKSKKRHRTVYGAHNKTFDSLSSGDMFCNALQLMQNTVEHSEYQAQNTKRS